MIIDNIPVDNTTCMVWRILDYANHMDQEKIPVEMVHVLALCGKIIPKLFP